ncbi:rod shape-determining protein MreC [Pseudothioclava arenosa]|uniref:Cell shape-determining protein MreC n=1 Tax=Pseudothioclava arenosa TaxID=1795308 RepID=A0A2A4CU32_9RHOB|nr:rod shape-determining protein MreC [Pseudothioclava arenosa]PCD78085.1 rod shape-determining protein MreC [Pseudothioclava arenosa]
MATNREEEDFIGPLRRILIAVLVLLLTGAFLFWRIDSPRAERMRALFIDRFVPTFDWAMVPVTKTLDMIEGFQSYNRIYEQNQELRRELRRVESWEEAAVQLEQQNAKLRALNNLRLDPKLTSVSGVVLADSGSPFHQSVLLNIGSRDGIVDGWAAVDGLGLVGRIAGVGETTSRLLLLTDSSSRIPVTIMPAGQRAIVSGDNSRFPPIDFLVSPELVRPGDRVVSSGDGGVFPGGLPVGEVMETRDGRLRVRLKADYEQLDFVRVLRSHPKERVESAGDLILPEEPVQPPEPEAPAEEATAGGGDG